VEHKRPNSPNRANRGIIGIFFGNFVLPRNQKYGLTLEKFDFELGSCEGGKNTEPRKRTNSQTAVKPFISRDISPEPQNQKKVIFEK
jgi:hypothetical protein